MIGALQSAWVSWRSRIQSRQKPGHRRRQNQAVRIETRLQDVVGDNAGATFAMRLAYLRKIDPLVFEEMTLDAFAAHGWRVVRGTRYSGDGGLDGRIYRDGVWCGIQCKRYRGEIHHAHVHQFVKDMDAEGIHQGFFVHTGRTPKSLQKPDGVVLLSGQALVNFIAGECA
jgi:restriction system protein